MGDFKYFLFFCLYFLGSGVWVWALYQANGIVNTAVILAGSCRKIGREIAGALAERTLIGNGKTVWTD